MAPLDANERERLEAAESALVMFGWCAVQQSQREQAALELWMRWSRLVPGEFLGPQAHPELDEVALAACRGAQRDQILTAIREGDGQRG